MLSVLGIICKIFEKDNLFNAFVFELIKWKIDDKAVDQTSKMLGTWGEFDAKLIFVVHIERLRQCCLLWELYARFLKKMADYSQLILSLVIL